MGPKVSPQTNGQGKPFFTLPERATILEVALIYAAYGWPVFPCKPKDKSPATPHGFKDATTNPEQIRRWWKRTPDALIGVPMGSWSGVFAIDLDRKEADKDGVASWAQLTAEHGGAPLTLSSTTPSTGQHHIFQNIEGIRCIPLNDLAPGVEVKAEGGYIVVAPSFCTDPKFGGGAGARYLWTRPLLAPAPAPDWLVDKILELCATPDFEPPPSNERPMPVERIKAALAVIDPDLDHKTWIAIGCALYRELGDAGFSHWDEWSSKSQQGKYDANIMAGQWKSISKKNGYAYTIGTVIYHANQAQPDWDHCPEDDRPPPRDSSQAAVLIKLAQGAELFHTPQRKAYADIQNDGHRETWSVRSRDFKLWLGRIYFKKTGKTPRREAMTAALDQIESSAIWGSPEREIYVRIGGLKDRIYLDLCDAAWRAIEIDAAGWRIVDRPPVRFRRAQGMLPLPLPVAGGSIDELRPFLNLQDENDFVLVVAWMLAALSAKGPYPVLVLSGEHGSAKTFFCSCMRALLDPNTAPNRTLPRDDRDLFIAAINGHLLAFDNVSSMAAWLSDAFCRLSTGGGFATRQLYTDDEEMLFTAKRPVILNGIEDTVVRPDLADRSIVLVLEPIEEGKRRTERDLLAEFEVAQPRVLGALLTAVATGLKMLPQTKLDHFPRMADFAYWITACEAALWEQGTFEAAYGTNRANLVEAVLEANPVAGAIRILLANKGGEWTGTATGLLADLNLQDIAGGVRRDRQYWPQTAHQMSGKLRRVAPMLRNIGVEVEFSTTREVRYITLATHRDAVRRSQVQTEAELPF